MIYTCVVCGQQFESPKYARACKEHRKELKKIQAKEFAAKRPNWKQEWGRNNYVAKRLPKRKGLEPLKEVEIEVGGKTMTLVQCHRLNVRAKHLPCGERYECHEPTKCPYAPPRSQPPKREFNPNPYY